MNPLFHAPTENYLPKPIAENPFQMILDVQHEHGILLQLLLERLQVPQVVSDKMSIIDASKFLDLSPSTIYKMTAQNTIPFTKREGSKKLVFSNKELTAWASTYQKTSKELAQELIHSKGRKVLMG